MNTVIDTNVLVSAILKWDSVRGFHLTEEIVGSVVGEIERLGVYVEAEKMDIDYPDDKDATLYSNAETDDGYNYRKLRMINKCN